MWRTDEGGFYYYDDIFLLNFLDLRIGCMGSREWSCAILYSINNVYILKIPQPTTTEFEKKKLHFIDYT